MKICLLGDTHFGVRNDSKAFHAYYEKFYTETFFPTLEENGVRTIIQLGDLFDRRKYINFLSLTESRRYFFDECAKRGITLHALIGNHDIFWRESLDVNSPELLLKDYDNIHLWSKHGTLEIDGVSIDMIPWICKDNEQAIFDFIKNTSSNYCVGHFELSGFPLMRGVENHEGIAGTFLSNYTKVYSGHYHTFSERDNVVYLGTPYELFWSDYKDTKKFLLLDLDDMKENYCPNPHRMFFKINYDDTNLTLEDLKKIEYNKYTDSYLKIVVLNKKNPYLFDKLLENVYKASPVDVTVVEDFTEIENVQDVDIVNQAEDTMTILSKYIDTQEINNCNVEDLKSLMRELYVEALSTENIE